MKQIWPDYSYSPATNVLTLTGLNIDRDQLLLVAAPERGRIMYNFADSSVTASAFTSGANTALTLVATTAGLTTTAALVIYFDDQATSSTVTGTVELGPTSLNALESITVTMGQVTVTGGLTDVQLRASAVTVGGTVTVGNFPASQAVTFGAVTGSVSVLNFPASQAVTFSAVSISNLPATQTIAGTVTANVTTKSFLDGLVAFAEDQTPLFVDLYNPIPAGTNRIGVVTIGAGTVTLGAGTAQIGSVTASISGTVPISISSVTVGNSVTIASLPALVAGTAQIGSVTASISNSVTIGSIPPIQWSNANGGNAPTTVNQNAPLPVQLYTGAVPSSVTIGATIANSVTIGSLPAISGTVTANLANVVTTDLYSVASAVKVTGADGQGVLLGGLNSIGNPENVYEGGAIPVRGLVAMDVPISGTVTANTFAVQGTAVTTSNFTSTTASTVLANYNATREVLTIFNEGAGNLFVCPGATCTTVQYQVRLSSGDYYEAPNHQTTITHSAVFATAGTARVTQVS